MRRWLFAGAVVLAFGIFAALFAPLRALDRVGPFDVKNAYDVAVFYCAARAVGHGDPYAPEPLFTCEHEFPNIFVDSTAPAPQPEYVLAAFAPLTRLGEPRFAFLWIVTSLAFATFATGMLVRLTGFPGYAIFLTLVLGAGFENFQYGQLSMLVVLGICGAAYALHERRASPAAAALALMLAEPHVALPAFAVLFALVPRSRITIVVVALVALAISLAVFGWPITFEYFARLLPLQALTETQNPEQYSASMIAALFGASDLLAVRIGEIQYIAFATGSLFLARRLWQRFDDAAFVVVLPAAAAVIGGPFIHYSETIAVVPAALVLARYASGRERIVMIAVLALVAYPWRMESGFSTRAAVAFAIAAIGIAVARYAKPSLRIATCAAFTVPVLVLGAVVHHFGGVAFAKMTGTASAFVSETARGAMLSPIAWGIHIRTDHTNFTMHELAMKVPTFFMLAMLVIVTIVMGVEPRGRQTLVKSAGGLNAGSPSES